MSVAQTRETVHEKIRFGDDIAETAGNGSARAPAPATETSCSAKASSSRRTGSVYEWFVGPIPKGLQLDHLCRVPHCVNPAHLSRSRTRRTGSVG